MGLIKAKQIEDLDLGGAVYKGIVAMGVADSLWTDVEVTVEADWAVSGSSVVIASNASIEGVVQQIQVYCSFITEGVSFVLHAHAPHGAYGVLNFNWQGIP